MDFPLSDSPATPPLFPYTFPHFRFSSPLNSLLSLAAHCFVSAHILSLEVPPLDHLTSPSTLTSVFLIHLSRLSLSGHLFGISSVASLCVRFFPLHVVFLHALNQLTAYILDVSCIPFFFCFHAYVEETTSAPNPITYHVLPHLPPKIHTVLIIAPF